MFYECPKCQSQLLGVVVKVAATLTQDEDNMETDIVGDAHEWDDQSVMWCGDCGYVGRAYNFRYED